MNRRFVPILLAVACLLASCGAVTAQPPAESGRHVPDASLENTYWRIVRLGEEPVSPIGKGPEPHLLLKEQDGRKSYAATVGCNRMAGGYSVDGETIRFTQGISTRMACPPPLDVLERKLLETLEKTRKWRIKGDTLEMFDAAGAPAARFEAVYF